MRHFVFATLCLSVFAACEPDGKINPVTVQWMDWPAVVDAGQPFRTRLVVWGVCAANPRFRPGADSRDVSAYGRSVSTPLMRRSCSKTRPIP